MRIVTLALAILLATQSVAAEYFEKKVVKNSDGIWINRITLDDQYQIDLPQGFVEAHHTTSQPLRGTYRKANGDDVIVIQFGETAQFSKGDLQTALQKATLSEIDDLKAQLQHELAVKIRSNKSHSLLNEPAVRVFYIGETRVIQADYVVAQTSGSNLPNLKFNELFVWAVDKQYYIPIVYYEEHEETALPVVISIHKSLRKQ
jgi:hypothetical protein